MVARSEFWHDRRVFVTGHTGFKGGWLCLWLQLMNAQVHGYSLAPPTTPNLYAVADVAEGLSSTTIADIRELNTVREAIQSAHPEIVFHLAAQPLVRQSYKSPVETFATNVMGTVNLLEAVRETPSVRSVVIVTSDKCYENREWHWGYRESDLLGGTDPYSSSKACSELVAKAYRRSFLQGGGVGVASARGGNVIGGGDWSEDRLIPDFLRATDTNTRLKVRHPNAVRPWQHVLEPLSGYLMLAERLYLDRETFADAWNFGPSNEDVLSVGQIVDYLGSVVPATGWEREQIEQPREANYLRLDSSKARQRLGWRPRWDIESALNMVMSWHREWRSGATMRDVTLRQIAQFQGGIPNECPV